VLNQLGYKQFPTYYFGVAIVGVTPIIMIVLSLPVWMLTSWCNERKCKSRSALKKAGGDLNQLT